MLEAFADLSTPLVADACVRRDVPLRAAPPGIVAVVPGRRMAGRALPARHYGKCRRVPRGVCAGRAG
jgi:4-hydroxy-4-methyl-2-oxoglutarate aldolase